MNAADKEKNPGTGRIGTGSRVLQRKNIVSNRAVGARRRYIPLCMTIKWRTTSSRVVRRPANAINFVPLVRVDLPQNARPSAVFP